MLLLKVLMYEKDIANLLDLYNCDMRTLFI